MRILVSSLLALVCLMPHQTLAQVSARGGQIQLSSDFFRIDEGTHSATYDGRVEVLQADSRLRADHVTINYSRDNAGNSPEIVNIQAEGNVYYVVTGSEQTSIVRGDKAVYTRADDTMVITGEIVLQRGLSVMTGTRLVAEIGKGVTTLTADAKKDGRIHGVLYPGSQK